METLKGFARRTTQSLREMVSGSETSLEEARLQDISNKVRVIEAKGEAICRKVIQAARLMEELGTTLKELGEEYKGVPDLPKESRELAEDVFIVGIKLVETSQEHQKGLKDNGFELLRAFSKQCSHLREVEETRRHHQLEYDFFRAKVQDLRSAPQKDFTRLPRNEQILESWRVELWRVTERSKALCSQLYVDGRRAVDRSVLTTVQVLHSFVEIASTGFTQTFQSVRLPSYPLEPVLLPTALPVGPASSQDPSVSSGGIIALPPSQGYGHAGGNLSSLADPGISSRRASLPSSSSGGGGATYASAPPAWAGGVSPQVAPPSPAASASSCHTPGSSLAYATSSQPLASGGAPGYQPPPSDPSSVYGNASSGYQPPIV
ncbi:hypothetical protein ABL78_6096 [Leptomonas seymouri]|uniref:BAR domain-containing protein n=1 Tax=Leptomonas seymouri TaxID=5684 RepID=A0A0N0P436_LEPSE|nr:hypothetical protein ABL78_6096 [Leptomonas seymouri]|eukprot:KPI84839.1 hypothetical protein ABL78_6096 [Leptomonas seymouri]